MMTTWEQGASADAAACRITDAGRENANLREMKVKENERNKENEAEFPHAEEPKGDRRIAFPSHTWEPREETGTTPYQEMVKPEVPTRDAIVWSRQTMQWKDTVNEEDENRLGGKNTLWLYLAFDFRAATVEKVSKMGRPQGEETLAALGKNFHLASRWMLQRCQHKEKHKADMDAGARPCRSRLLRIP